MTLRQTAWFIAAHVGLVAVAIWFDLAILCQGDVKYSGGCGGFGLYIPLWEVFLAPMPIAAILLELWRKAAPPPTSRLLVYLGGILVVAAVGFPIIEEFPALLATQGAAIAVVTAVRWGAIQRAPSAR